MNKVFIMGYSHGGYGAFAIGPKIPYRFAAIHASAAAPTDGETTAKTLRNTRFSFMIGGKDTRTVERIDVRPSMPQSSNCAEPVMISIPSPFSGSQTTDTRAFPTAIKSQKCILRFAIPCLTN